MGIKLSVLTIFSTWVNDFLKMMFHAPRPYDFDSSVGRASESSSGFPSGHAQSVFVFCLGFSSWRKKSSVYIAAIIFILVMSFTRLYLGVHFPTDIFGGWIAGFVVLALYWFFAERIIKVLAVASIRFRLIISAAVSFIMLILNPEQVKMAGIFLGLGMGYTLMLRFFPFDVKTKKNGKKADTFTLGLRYVLGLACMGILLFLGTKFIALMGETSSVYRIVTFAVYAAIGSAVTAGVPWLFIQTGLSAKKAQTQ
jgi:hypothetical protein